MKNLKCSDGNILNFLNSRAIDPQQVPYEDHNFKRTMQMHSSLIQRLALDSVMEGHQGCVNALAWNADGSMLLSGSDDTLVNVWDYANRKLLHSVDSGHSANIFCVKFVPETCNDVVVSGAGDAEVRVHRLSYSMNSASGKTNSSEQTAFFRCHSKRVKKLAVEDGNPHVIWSASEDGTLRQHDLRESVLCPPNGSADHECRNVLLDLRCGSKRSLSDSPRQSLALKTCAINSVRPHQLLVGGSDAFARLYDRRMLPPLTSSRLQAKTPLCVCYFCPAHLSDYSRSGLHLTHVTFSPNGQEVLLSYSGEHVYLMDANNGKDDVVAYMASDVPKRIILTPVVNGVSSTSTAAVNGLIGVGCKRRSSPKLEECRELLSEGREALKEDNYIYAIETTSEVLDAGGPLVDSKLRHDGLCIRALSFLKRLWKNDVHMAIRDCNEARAVDPQSVQAHLIMAEALSQLQKHNEALDYAMRAHSLDPSCNEIAEKVTALRSKLVAAEEANNNRNGDGDAKLERRTSRIRSLSDILFRSETDQSDSSPDNRRAEREDSDLDDDMEMEMEIEMSVAGEDERDRESGGRPGSSLNLRLRRRVDFNRDRSIINQASSSGGSNENMVPHMEVALDMKQRYVGHCNVGTDIKQASFLGEQGDFVASGSDDGRWFVWQKKTGRLLKMLKGDENVVNCVQCHPFDCAIATSGIDNTIKMWTPSAEVASIVAGGETGPETADLLQIMGENQQRMRRPREIGLPLEFFQRFRVPESGIRPFECTQS